MTRPQDKAHRRAFARHVAILAIAGFAVLMAIAGRISLMVWEESQPDAPEQLVEVEPCSYCMSGEKWKASRNVEAYLRPPTTIHKSPPAAERRIVPAGEWVATGTTMHVVALRKEAILAKDSITDTHRQSLKKSDKLYLFHYLGEGCARVWVESRSDLACSLSLESVEGVPWEIWSNNFDRPERWWVDKFWVEIKRSDGTALWTPYREHFQTQGQINDSISLIIADTQLSLGEKLERIDAALQQGAELNGVSSKHGRPPIWAAIASGDFTLLAALRRRGLSLVSRYDCTARMAVYTGFQPNGDVMLRYLLENGMSLKCLDGPALHSFFGFGINSSSYSIANAIKIADVLLAHGANVSERDKQGKSIIEFLNVAKSQKDLSPLKQHLERRR